MSASHPFPTTTAPLTLGARAAGALLTATALLGVHTPAAHAHDIDLAIGAKKLSISTRKAPGRQKFRFATSKQVAVGIAQPRSRAGDVFELADLIEKPEVADAPSNLAVAARYVFSPKIFDYLARTPPGKGNEIQLTDAIRMLMSDGHNVLGVRLPNGQRRFDIGNFQSYFEAFAEFALADEQYGPALRRFAERLFKDKT